MNDKLFLHDSETLKHVNKVRENLLKVISDLDHRAQVHDKSKFEEPERSILAENTPELVKTVYGSEEYKAMLDKIKPALDHHYANNRHHPEHFTNGVDDMNLLDIVEMLADWTAATERNKNGNVHKSIEHNSKRFNLCPQLAKILTNTVNRYF